MSRKRRTNANTERPLHPTPGRSRRVRLFYVAVEGESTEPDYLDYLNKEFGLKLGFRVHTLWRRNGLKPREVVERVLAQHAEHDDEFWVMFDRDQHDGIPQALAAAKTNGIRVAFSHPSFDLWLLLHFTAFSGAQSGSSGIVHDKLRKCPGFETFAVDGDKHVRGKRIDALRGNERVAALRARKLTSYCVTAVCDEHSGHAGYCDPLRRDPSTDVWRLLVELRIIDRWTG